MLFMVPGHSVEFEIPDEWWEAAGMAGFSPLTEAFVAIEDPRETARIVSFKEILPPNGLRARRCSIAIGWSAFSVRSRWPRLSRRL